MSFRTRLTTFFLLIVIVPMVGVSALVLRLISDSQQGKIDARAAGLATSAESVYAYQTALARADAAAVAAKAVLTPGPRLAAEVARLVTRSGLARIELTRGGRVIAAAGDPQAIAPGFAQINEPSGPPITIGVSTLTATDYGRELSTAAGSGIVVRIGGHAAFASPSGAATRSYAGDGNTSLGGTTYRYRTQSFTGFNGQPVDVTVLSDRSATSSNASSSRLVAAGFIAGFLVLAFAFSVLASRALEGQLGDFLAAARRLGSGDFSAPVQVVGGDDFAALGVEFNNMSAQLAKRLDELSQERARLLESIRRTGRTFASNLDRRALLDLALRSAVDAVTADGGRLTLRRSSSERQFVESLRVGDLTGLEAEFVEAERLALSSGEFGEAAGQGARVATIVLGSADSGGPAQALISVARRESSFSDEDRELLRSLARQATLALENVHLHVQVSRQAVTDELTGLANHGRFQELLSTEIEQVRRYHHSIGLIMIDIDNFKSVNDTYGHQQGDVVLREVAGVLRESSRDADAPARYGGEELALILPHTDLEGSYAIAERVRTAIEALRIPRLDQDGVLRITASLGVAAASAGEKEGLITEADSALYTAKRSGKNRTVRAPLITSNLRSAE
ncbi:MAG: GGDEF domain-containing protein [Solirubrobacteraceae bacterium]